jgi:hypothetical protein
MARRFGGLISGMHLILATACAVNDEGTDETSGPSGAGVIDGSGSSQQCGGKTCSKGQRCLPLSNWSCKSDPVACYPDPSINCVAVLEQACGCDGQVYKNECAAYAAGTDLAGYAPACTPPAGTFACGYTFCKAGQEACLEHYEAGWTCEPLPDACKGESPSCNCIGNTADGYNPDWGTLYGDRRCVTCADDGPGIKLKCSAFY